LRKSEGFFNHSTQRKSRAYHKDISIGKNRKPSYFTIKKNPYKACIVMEAGAGNILEGENIIYLKTLRYV